MVRFRVVVRGVSPVVVRTLVVPTSVSLQLLHEALLVCFGWSGEHLHHFTIRGIDYSSDWIVDAARSHDVVLASLGLRMRERFTWRYDFSAGWVIDLRVEAGIDDDGSSLRCLGGKRAGPPEWCGGVAGFYAWEDNHSLVEFIECLDVARDGVDADGQQVEVADAVEHLRVVARWVLRDRFERAGVNRRLQLLEVRSCVSSSRSG